MTGVAIGMALAGLRPIHVHIRMDFLMLAMNQLVNIAAKSRYMYGGQVHVPLVVRSMIGKSWGQGAQHSQGLHSLLHARARACKVVAPTTPYDAKGCLIAAIRDDNPVIFVEHRLLHFQTGPVPEAPYTVPPGKARVAAPGDDVTLVGISHMQVECLRARSAISQTSGIAAEVIDPIWLSPLDIDTIAASVAKTGRLLVVDNGWTSCGAGAEIVAARGRAAAGRARRPRPAAGLRADDLPDDAGARGPLLPERAHDRRRRARPGRGRADRLAARRAPTPREIAVQGAVLMITDARPARLAADAEQHHARRPRRGDRASCAGRPDPDAVEAGPSLRAGVVASGSACGTACSSTPARRPTCSRWRRCGSCTARGEVIVPTLTWVSDIAAVLQCGFTPVFVDIDPRTLGHGQRRRCSRSITPRTRAVFLTHVLGYNALDRRAARRAAARAASR